MSELREQIQSLIANNQTEDALALLAQSSTDALLLQAQYNSGKKNFNLGLIEFGEWQRIQSRVNYGALEMAGRERIMPTNNGNSTATTQVPVTSTQPAVDQPKVFISYNHNDTFAMRSVKTALEGAGIKVFVDVVEMQAGENIQAFINRALQGNTFILSLISKNSLISGWVNVELSTAITLNNFGKKWIPASLDKSFMEQSFYSKTSKSFDDKIAKSKAGMLKALSSNIDTRPFQDELNRLEDAKSNFGKVIQILRQTLVVDVSQEMFDLGIQKVISTIKS